MRRGQLVFAACVVVSVVALVIVLAGQKTNLAFTLGVAPQSGVAKLAHGQTVCQRTINVAPSSSFDRIALEVGTFRRPGPELAVVVRHHGDGRQLAAATLPGGYADIVGLNPMRSVTVGHVAGGQGIDVCITNRGRHAVALYGGGALANRVSDAVQDGKPAPYDLTLVFHRDERSHLSMIGDVFARASLFRPGFVGTWTYWLLALLLVVAVPVLLWRALGAAADEPADPER